MNLEEFLVRGLPGTVYYIPDVVTEAEEALLLERISRTPKTKWTQLRNRRLQNWGGLPHVKGMIPEQMPDWLEDVIQRVMDRGGGQAFGLVRPNHILLNEYLPGQGISPHLDGDLFYPTIATVSLGSHTVLNYYRPLDNEEKTADDFGHEGSQFGRRLAFSVLLQPRSLLLVKDSMYTDYLHGIADTAVDELTDAVIVPDKTGRQDLAVGQKLSRQTRISLTIRHVPKTLKNFKLKF